MVSQWPGDPGFESHSFLIVWASRPWSTMGVLAVVFCTDIPPVSCPACASRRPALPGSGGKGRVSGEAGGSHHPSPTLGVQVEHLPPRSHLARPHLVTPHLPGHRPMPEV